MVKSGPKLHVHVAIHYLTKVLRRSIIDYNAPLPTL